MFTKARQFQFPAGVPNIINRPPMPRQIKIYILKLSFKLNKKSLSNMIMKAIFAVL